MPSHSTTTLMPAALQTSASWLENIQGVIPQFIAQGSYEPRIDHSTSLGDQKGAVGSYCIWDLMRKSPLEMLWETPPESIYERLTGYVNRNRAYLNGVRRTTDTSTPGFQLWFIGKEAQLATPAVLITDDNGRYCKRLRKVIRQSDILSKYDIGLKVVPNRKIKWLGGNSPEAPKSSIKSPGNSQKSWCGARICSEPFNADKPSYTATISGTIMVDWDRPYGREVSEFASLKAPFLALTVAHPFMTEILGSPLDSETNKDESHCTGLSPPSTPESELDPFDDYISDGEDDGWILNKESGVMEPLHGTVNTPQDEKVVEVLEDSVSINPEMKDSAWASSVKRHQGYQPADGIAVGSALPALPWSKATPSLQPLVISEDMTLDWAVLVLENLDDWTSNTVLVSKPSDHLEPITLSNITNEPPPGRVWAILGSRGVVGGKRVGSIASLQLGCYGDFQEVWTIELEEIPEPGDSGSWIIDAISHDVVGTLVARQQTSGVLYVIPIAHTFKEIEQTWRCKVRLPSSADVQAAHENLSAMRNLIIEAVMRDDLVLTRMLIRKCGILNTKNYSVSTPLFIAIRRVSENMVRLLLELGADPNTKDEKGVTPLSIATAGYSEQIMMLLLERGADPNTKDEKGVTPLSIAIKSNSKRIVRLLLERGAEINTSDEKGVTPLSIAIRSRSKRIVILLLERGAEINALDKNGVTPLLVAAGSNSESIVRLLLERGADPNTKDEKGVTPLSIAAARASEQVVMLLLERGADPDTKDEMGLTSLSIAIASDSAKIVKLLLEWGADPDIKSKTGSTPLSLATAKKSEEMVANLLAQGANPNIKDCSGLTPLFIATVRKSEKIAELLSERGARSLPSNDPSSIRLSEAIQLVSSRTAEMLHEMSAGVQSRLQHWRAIKSQHRQLPGERPFDANETALTMKHSSEPLLGSMVPLPMSPENNYVDLQWPGLEFRNFGHGDLDSSPPPKRPLPEDRFLEDKSKQTRMMKEESDSDEMTIRLWG